MQLRPYFRHIRRLCSRFTAWQPLTMRGALAFFLPLLGIYLIGYPEMDLVLLILSGGLVLLVIIVFVLSCVFRYLLRRRLQVEAHFDQRNPLSRQALPSGIVFKGSSLPPYFSLEVSRQFVHRGTIAPEHLLFGAEPELGKRHLIDAVYFPHRGAWQLGAIRCSLVDALGFSKTTWDISQTASVEVSAVTIPIKPLPVVAASARAGDQLSLSRERSGDLFDIKQYDPSDGVKRILWKTYAKSGTLVVRRPEPAIIPEGEVAVYLIARREDDHVAGTLQHYLKQLYDHQITILFGTDGMLLAQGGPQEHVQGKTNEELPIRLSATSQVFCSEPEIIRASINHSVWRPLAGRGADFSMYMESLQASNRLVEQVIVFAAADSLNSSEDTSWFKEVSHVASVHGTRLSIALVQRQVDYSQRSESVNPRKYALVDTLGNGLSKALPKTLNISGNGKSELEAMRELSGRILNSGADLHIVEAYE